MTKTTVIVEMAGSNGSATSKAMNSSVKLTRTTSQTTSISMDLGRKYHISKRPCRWLWESTVLTQRTLTTNSKCDMSCLIDFNMLLDSWRFTSQQWICTASSMPAIFCLLMDSIRWRRSSCKEHLVFAQEFFAIDRMCCPLEFLKNWTHREWKCTVQDVKMSIYQDRNS